MAAREGEVALDGVGAGTTPLFTPAYRRYALGLLTVVYTVNYMDRQILSILLQPIKEDLALSDTQLGFLFTTFGIFYATFGLPIAMLADRTNRRNLIAVSLTVFSAMTAVCAFVVNFWQLALARIMVGIGEAGSSPPSHAIIADMYKPAERATALAIFATGVNIGLLVGLIVGGLLAEAVGWRYTFLIVGLPGVLLALIVVATMREPPRGYADGIGETAPVHAPPVLAVLRYLLSQPSFRHIAVGATLVSFVGYGAVAWLPPFMARSHGMSIGDIGVTLGLIVGIAGGIGTFGGGWLADKLSLRDVRWNMWVIAIAGLAGLPFSIATFLSSEAWRR